MMTLKQVTINKYKCIETKQSFEVEPDVTVLVGKNESGKTAVLEAITKSNSYHSEQFDTMQDYPRKEVKKFERGQDDARVIQCTYTLQDKLIKQIQEDIGPKTFGATEITHSSSYRNPHGTLGAFDLIISDFFNYKLRQHTFEDEMFKNATSNVVSRQDFDELRKEYQSGTQQEFLGKIASYFTNGQDLETSLHKYVVSKWIEPHLPKFLYYDEYYSLPSDIDIRKMQNNHTDEKELKTAKALFELADINIGELLEGGDYEACKAELEATGTVITETLFEYWKTNENLHVQFDIERPLNNYSHPVLKIRIYNIKYRITLPLASRSRGFNWFFSFLVWFSKIQEDRDTEYILLLDEPGLNLHASAQADLMRFVEKLTEDYQLIYTTHSPFMIDSDKLHRVRTVLETDNGTKISESIQEKDPGTLFPLQAALGYDIAQNLFITKNNLLIEGPSDLVYLQVLSSILEGTNQTALREDITLVPVGGLGKVATFISLLRGQELNIVCLLDTFTDQKSKSRIGDLVKQKIIREKNVRFFDEFAGNGENKADLEDLFNKDEYLKLFNQSFDKYPNINLKDLDTSEKRIVQQIRKYLGVKRFNHHRPANELAKQGVDAEYFSDETLNRFEKMFKEINKLFPSNS